MSDEKEYSRGRRAPTWYAFLFAGGGCMVVRMSKAAPTHRPVISNPIISRNFFARFNGASMPACG